MSDFGNLTKKIGNQANKISRQILSKTGLELSRGKKIYLFIFIILIVLFIGLIVNEVKKSSFEISHINDFELFIKDPHKADISVVVEGNKLESSNTNEFCYTFWIYINSSMWNNEDSNLNKWKHILHRGSHNSTDSNLDLQVPGVWLWPNTNRLWCVLSTENGPEYGEGLIYDDIPVNKWTHVSLSLVNNIFDLYINGKLERTITLYRNPKTVNNSDHLYLFGISNDINSLMTSSDNKDVIVSGTTEDECSKCQVNVDKCETIIDEDEDEENNEENLNTCKTCGKNDEHDSSNLFSNRCICIEEENYTDSQSDSIYPMDGFMAHFKYFNKYVSPTEIYNIYKEKASSIKDKDYSYLEKINSLESVACEDNLCFSK
jgi:hypothetical protein